MEYGEAIFVKAAFDVVVGIGDTSVMKPERAYKLVSSWFKDDTDENSSSDVVHWEFTTGRRFQETRQKILEIHIQDAQEIFDN
ncbi:hypothetical protein ACNR90_003518 [Candidozyma auris]